MIPRYRIVMLLAAVLVGCSKPASTPLPSTTAEVEAPPVFEIPGYKDLRQITKERVYVSPYLAGLCVNASAEQVEAERLRHGPHANTSILIYMNQLAADAFAKRVTPFPVGAVVVKRKNAYEYRDKEGKWARSDKGVGGMVKRAPGYDPAHGDWEYFYFEDPAKIESGPIASCVKCHESAKATDYVFGTWQKSRDELESEQ